MHEISAACRIYKAVSYRWELRGKLKSLLRRIPEEWEVVYNRKDAFNGIIRLQLDFCALVPSTVFDINPTLLMTQWASSAVKHGDGSEAWWWLYISRMKLNILTDDGYLVDRFYKLPKILRIICEPLLTSLVPFLLIPMPDGEIRLAFRCMAATHRSWAPMPKKRQRVCVRMEHCGGPPVCVARPQNCRNMRKTRVPSVKVGVLCVHMCVWANCWQFC